MRLRAPRSFLLLSTTLLASLNQGEGVRRIAEGAATAFAPQCGLAPGFVSIAAAAQLMIKDVLVTEHPEGCKLFGWMQGPIEFYDDEAKLIETADVWWMMNHYEDYMREQGLPINEKLYV